MLTANLVMYISRHGLDHVLEIVAAWQEAGSPTAEALRTEYTQFQKERLDYAHRLERAERRRRDDYDL